MKNKKILRKKYNAVSLDAVHTHTHEDFKGLKKYINKERGITLIALVITIIVLLILAGVAIITLTGDNGILNKAQSAKTNTDESQELEQIQLAATTAKINENNTIDKQVLYNELKNTSKLQGLPDNADKIEFPLIVTWTTGRQYVIDEKGNVIKKEIKIPASDYGTEVIEYNAKNAGVNKWRVFYDDGINVYLIANNYVEYDDIKDVKRKNEVYKIEDYRFSFCNIITDSTYSEGSKWIIENSKAKKWLNEYLSRNPDSKKENIKSVAYLMDTKIWSDKFGGDQAEYVIGGPTIEMYCASYKETHPNEYIECEAESSSNGYKLKWNKDTNYENTINYMKKMDYNGIYITPEDKWGMYVDQSIIASPAAGFHRGVLTAGYWGGIGVRTLGSSSDSKRSYPGVRPVVCLKYNTQFTKNPDGSYTIK